MRGAEFAEQILALGRVKGIGIHALRALLTHYGGLRDVWDEDTPRLRDILARARVRGAAEIAADIRTRRHELLAEAEREREVLARRRIRVIGPDDRSFPRQFDGLPDAPAWLFVEGNPSVLNAAPMIAVVGTRDASHAAVMAAQRVTKTVISAGFTLVSGLAEGIDSAAHGVAALFGTPQVAVLGTGINGDFPASTRGLRRRIVDAGGAVVTEYLPDERYGRANFVQRNRIQAGLSVAVCPVEGRAKSGTAHTIRFAKAYRRKLFGVTLGRPDSQNEVLALLADMGAPVFDLDTDEDAFGLDRFLESLPGARQPSLPTPDPEFLFRDVLRELDELGTDLTLTPQLGKWLMNRVARRFGLEPRRREPGNGG